jgi:hypothetical protein
LLVKLDNLKRKLIQVLIGESINSSAPRTLPGEAQL